MLNRNRLQLQNFRHRCLNRIANAASAIVIAIGCLVLIGWCFDVALLKTSLIGSTATMKANTALCFILSGVSLWLVGAKQSVTRTGNSAFRLRISRVCALTVTVIALLTLSQYWFGWNLGIDQLLFRDTADAITVSSGRIGYNTALSFVLVSSALLLLGQRTHRSYKYAQILALLAGLIALQALIGHAYRVEIFYGAAPYTTSMVLHTALTFTIRHLLSQYFH